MKIISDLHFYLSSVCTYKGMYFSKNCPAQIVAIKVFRRYPPVHIRACGLEVLEGHGGAWGASEEGHKNPDLKCTCTCCCTVYGTTFLAENLIVLDTTLSHAYLAFSWQTACIGTSDLLLSSYATIAYTLTPLSVLPMVLHSLSHCTTYLNKGHRWLYKTPLHQHPTPRRW